MMNNNFQPQGGPGQPVVMPNGLVKDGGQSAQFWRRAFVMLLLASLVVVALLNLSDKNTPGERSAAQTQITQRSNALANAALFGGNGQPGQMYAQAKEAHDMNESPLTWQAMMATYRNRYQQFETFEADFVVYEDDTLEVYYDSHREMAFFVRPTGVDSLAVDWSGWVGLPDFNMVTGASAQIADPTPLGWIQSEDSTLVSRRYDGTELDRIPWRRPDLEDHSFSTRLFQGIPMYMSPERFVTVNADGTFVVLDAPQQFPDLQKTVIRHGDGLWAGYWQKGFRAADEIEVITWDAAGRPTVQPLFAGGRGGRSGAVCAFDNAWGDWVVVETGRSGQSLVRYDIDGVERGRVAWAREWGPFESDYLRRREVRHAYELRRQRDRLKEDYVVDFEAGLAFPYTQHGENPVYGGRGLCLVDGLEKGDLHLLRNGEKVQTMRGAEAIGWIRDGARFVVGHYDNAALQYVLSIYHPDGELDRRLAIAGGQPGEMFGRVEQEGDELTWLFLANKATRQVNLVAMDAEYDLALDWVFPGGYEGIITRVSSHFVGGQVMVLPDAVPDAGAWRRPAAAAIVPADCPETMFEVREDALVRHAVGLTGWQAMETLPLPGVHTHGPLSFVNCEGTFVKFTSGEALFVDPSGQTHFHPTPAIPTGVDWRPTPHGKGISKGIPKLLDFTQDEMVITELPLRPYNRGYLTLDGGVEIVHLTDSNLVRRLNLITGESAMAPLPPCPDIRKLHHAEGDFIVIAAGETVDGPQRCYAWRWGEEVWRDSTGGLAYRKGGSYPSENHTITRLKAISVRAEQVRFGPAVTLDPDGRFVQQPMPLILQTFLTQRGLSARDLTDLQRDGGFLIGKTGTLQFVLDVARGREIHVGSPQQEIRIVNDDFFLLGVNGEWQLQAMSERAIEAFFEG